MIEDSILGGAHDEVLIRGRDGDAVASSEGSKFNHSVLVPNCRQINAGAASERIHSTVLRLSDHQSSRIDGVRVAAESVTQYTQVGQHAMPPLPSMLDQ